MSDLASPSKSKAARRVIVEVKATVGAKLLRIFMNRFLLNDDGAGHGTDLETLAKAQCQRDDSSDVRASKRRAMCRFDAERDLVRFLELKEK